MSGHGNGSESHSFSISVTAVLVELHWQRVAGKSSPALEQAVQGSMETASLEVSKRCIGVMDLALLMVELNYLRELSQT